MGTKRMDQLKIGDPVLRSDVTYAKMYSFGHKEPKQKTAFLQIVTEGAKAATPLEITAEHLIYKKEGSDAAGKQSVVPVAAGQVKAGDILIGLDGYASVVKSVRSVQRVGAYAPLTSSGDPLVNGVLVSNYVTREWLKDAPGVTGFMLHYLQHGVVLPYRIFCSFKAGGCEDETYDEKTGFSPRVKFWYRLEQRQLTVGGGFQAAFLVMLAVPAMLAVIVGKLLSSSFNAFLLQGGAVILGLCLICGDAAEGRKKRAEDTVVKQSTKA